MAYAEAVIGTDRRIADLVLDYAARLAEGGQAATIVIPAVVDGGTVQDVTMLLGPASQIAMWTDDEPFPGAPEAAVAMLQQRIDALRGGVAGGEVSPLEVDEFDGLEGSTDPDGFGRD